MKYIALAVVVAFLLVACAVPLTPEGQKVRTISTTVAVQCRHVGMVHSFKAALEGSYLAAQVDARNKTAAAGGNAVVWINQTQDRNGGGEVLGEAYACQF